jgi:uncharacterized protein YlaN (UPF0358 family)
MCKTVNFSDHAIKQIDIQAEISNVKKIISLTKDALKQKFCKQLYSELMDFQAYYLQLLQYQKTN